MATELIVSLLRRQSLFEGLSEAELKELADIAKSERFPEKARIVEQGELKPVYYIILSGEAIARSIDEFGRERPVRYFKEGDSFGETSLLVGEPRDATVIARTDLEVLFIEKGDFEALLRRRPEIRRKLRPRPEVKRLWEAPRYDWMVEGEVTVWHGHRHWSTLTGWFLSSILFFAFIALLTWGIMKVKWVLCWAFPGLLFLGWAFWTSLELWNWLYDRYIVTNRRVALIETIPYQVAARQEAPLERIQEIDIQKGFPGTLFGVGDLIISTAARTRPIVFSNISNPEEVEKIVQEQRARALRWERAEERGRIKRIMLGEVITAAPPSQQPTKSLPHFFYAFRGEKREPDQVTWYTHPWVLIKKIFLPLFTFVASGLASGLSLPFLLRLKDYILMRSCASSLLILSFILSALWLVTMGLDWANERYIVTPNQIIMLRITPLLPIIPPVWVLQRIERKMAPMASVQDVTTRMSAWGRILRIGDVLITTAAPAGVLEFKNVRDPLKVQNTIFEFLERFQEAQKRERMKETERLLEDWFQVHREVDHS